MITFDVRHEATMLRNRFLIHARDRWYEGVLVDWCDAYAMAHARLFAHVDASHHAMILLVLRKAIGLQTVGIETLFGPIHWPLRRFGVRVASHAPLITERPASFMVHRRMEFGRLLEICGEGLRMFVDHAERQAMNREIFEGFRSRVLLSPVWYPPLRSDVEELARRLELRILACMWLDGHFQPGPEIDAVLEIAAGIDLRANYPLDYDRLSDIYNRAIFEDGLTRSARARRKKALRPLAEELCRPDPLAYALPPHAKRYCDAVQACNENLVFAQVDPNVVLHNLPYQHLDWTNVPP